MELLPCVRIRRCRKNLTQLVAVDTELKQGHLVGLACKCAHPGRKSVGLIGLHRNLFRPYVCPRACGAIDHHEVACPSMAMAYETLMMQAGVVIHVISSFSPKIGVVLIS